MRILAVRGSNLASLQGDFEVDLEVGLKGAGTFRAAGRDRGPWRASLGQEVRGPGKPGVLPGLDEGWMGLDLGCSGDGEAWLAGVRGVGQSSQSSQPGGLWLASSPRGSRGGRGCCNGARGGSGRLRLTAP